MCGPDRVVREYFSVVWYGHEAPHLKVVPYDPAHQTFWEFAMLLLSLCVWADRFTDSSIAILGDNKAALTNALKLQGRGPLQAIARELSWRKERRRWSFSVGHLPSEFNEVTDALSRITDPKGAAFPSHALASAVPVSPPRLQDLWMAEPF